MRFVQSIIAACVRALGVDGQTRHVTGTLARVHAVRFSLDIERTDTSENPFGINSATSEDASACAPASEPQEGSLSIDLGFLQPEARYRAVICPVTQGTRLKGFECDNEDIRACLSTDPAAADGPVAACEVRTPLDGTVRSRLSLDLINEDQSVQRRDYEIIYQVMPPAKGHPSIKAFVHCLDKNGAVSRAGST